jgi:four helix bundle protein
MFHSPIRDFRDLLVWQQAMELALESDVVADALPRRHWKLASQIRSSANTVHAAIAEGSGTHTTANYLRYLGMADASLGELRSHLTFVRRRYPKLEQANTPYNRLIRVEKLLKGLIAALSRKIEE